MYSYNTNKKQFPNSEFVKSVAPSFRNAVFPLSLSPYLYNPIVIVAVLAVVGAVFALLFAWFCGIACCISLPFLP